MTTPPVAQPWSASSPGPVGRTRHPTNSARNRSGSNSIPTPAPPAAPQATNTTRNTTTTRPASPATGPLDAVEPEPRWTVERVERRSPWPLLTALGLTVIVGPATAWLLLSASLTPFQRLAVAAGVPITLGLLTVASTHLDRSTSR